MKTGGCLKNTGQSLLTSCSFAEAIVPVYPNELVDIKTVCQGMGKPPYVHALMGSALALYLQPINE